MRNLFIILSSFCITLATAGVVHAVQLQVDYPAVGGEDFVGGGPLAWLRYIFLASFALIGIVAFASLIYAGIRWMTSRTEGGISDAKDRIKGTLIGLLLAGASVLLLTLINPDLVNLREPSIQLPQSPDRGEIGEDENPAYGGTTGFCAYTSDCAQGYWCKSTEGGFIGVISKCAPQKESGSCSKNEECLSGNCSSGQCVAPPKSDPLPVVCTVGDPSTCPNGYSCVKEAFNTQPSCKPTTGGPPVGQTQCNDGIDNDFDGEIDYPGDIDCQSASDEYEGTDASSPYVVDDSIPRPTNLSITGPSTIYTDGSQPTYTFKATVSPGEQVIMNANTHYASSYKVVTADAQGVATVTVSPILPKVCTAATPGGGTGRDMKLQANRLGADGFSISPTAIQTYNVIEYTPLCQ